LQWLVVVPLRNGFQIFGFEDLVTIHAANVVNAIPARKHLSAAMIAALHTEDYNYSKHRSASVKPLPGIYPNCGWGISLGYGRESEAPCYARAMRRFVVLLAATALSSSAWNNAGHKIAAAIAYKNLKPNARMRVDALLARHPDFDRMLTRGAPPDPVERSRYAFLVATTWPDLIRNDPRFWDDTKPDAQPTPAIPGFPDSKRHTNWHYKDIPFSTDGTPTEEQRPPNALTELVRIIDLLDSPPGHPSNPAYHLPWFLHLASDVHNPLHCVSRFTKSLPKGDAGGNEVWVAPGMRLHAVWDEALGRDDTYAAVIDAAEILRRQHPEPSRLATNPERWIEEGFELAKREVYTFGEASGTKETPLQLPDSYRANASRVARERVALAGYRMAKILNDKLK
jgi:hypothetical protein